MTWRCPPAIRRRRGDTTRRGWRSPRGCPTPAPENAFDYARDLSISYNRLGDLALSGGDPATAPRFYQDGLAIRKRLSDAAPENADYARDLSVSYERLGDLAMSAGDAAARGALLRRRSEDTEASVRRAARERPVRPRPAGLSYNKLGGPGDGGGDPAAARRYYEDGLKIRKPLSDAAPENADYARDLSISYERLGDLARSGGDPAAARQFYQDGLVIRKLLYAAAPDNADYARDLSVSYDRLGDLRDVRPVAIRLQGWRGQGG